MIFRTSAQNLGRTSAPWVVLADLLPGLLVAVQNLNGSPVVVGAGASAGIGGAASGATAQKQSIPHGNHGEITGITSGAFKSD